MVNNKTENQGIEPILEAGASLGVIGVGVMGRARLQGILRAGLLTSD
jgi:hypothetical protein